MRSSATIAYLLLVVAVFSASMSVWEVSANQETKKQRKLVREKSKQQPKIRRTIRVREEEPKPTELPSSDLSTTSTTDITTQTITEAPPQQPLSINNELLNQGSTNNIEVKPEISIQMPSNPPHPMPHPSPVQAQAPQQTQPQPESPPPQSIVVNQEQTVKGPEQEQQQTTEAPAEQQGKVSDLVNKFNQLERQNSGPPPGREHVELDGVGNSRVLKMENSGNQDHVEILGTGNTRHLTESEPQNEDQHERKVEEPEEEPMAPMELHNAASAAKLEEPTQNEAPVLAQQPKFLQSHLGRLIARAAAEQNQQQPPPPQQAPTPMAPSNFMLLPQAPQGGYTFAAQPLIMSPTIYGVMQAPYLAAAAGPNGAPAVWVPPAGFSMQPSAPQMLQPLATAMTPSQMIYNTQASSKLPAGHPACVTSWMTKPRKTLPKNNSDKRPQL